MMNSPVARSLGSSKAVHSAGSPTCELLAIVEPNAADHRPCGIPPNRSGAVDGTRSSESWGRRCASVVTGWQGVHDSKGTKDDE